jgi:hypothetical protein
MSYHAVVVCLAALALPAICAALPAAPGVELVWDSGHAEFVTRGGYGRAKRLANGEFALVWSDGPVKDTAVYIKKKPSASAANWGPRVRVATPGKAAAAENPDYRYVNSELAGLADGRLFYTWNARPIVRNGHLPYKIMGAFSSDGGATWGDARDLYVAGKTRRTGCWEPCPIQMPDGELQVWFADESTTPAGDQNITVLRSRDNGVTWLPPVVACHRKGHRDGMPVPVLLRDNMGLVFAIEDNGFARNNILKPAIIRPFHDENWRAVVDGDSPRRWPVFPPKELRDPGFGGGAPYLIQLDTGETVLSVQCWNKQDGVEKGAEQRNLRVYVGDAEARNFGNPTTPFLNLPGKAHAKWNSLCQVDRDTLIAVSTLSGLPENNGIWVVTAKLVRRAGK